MNTRVESGSSRREANDLLSSFPGKYMIETPGQKGYVPYFSDPNIRLQKWAGNMRSNSFAVEAGLQGRNRGPLVGGGIREEQPVASERISYSTNDDKITDFARIIDPAWTLREQINTRWDIPLKDQTRIPQNSVPVPMRTDLYERDRQERLNTNLKHV